MLHPGDFKDAPTGEQAGIESQGLGQAPRDRGCCGPQQDVAVKCCRARAGGEACEGVGRAVGGWRGLLLV